VSAFCANDAPVLTRRMPCASRSAGRAAGRRLFFWLLRPRSSLRMQPMYRPLILLSAVIITATCLVFAQNDVPGKQRVIVLTDISNEPDDEESMVRFLVYSNEYDVEGIIATTSTWLRNRTRLDLIERQIAAYGEVRDNLQKHAPGFPSVAHLREVAKAGSSEYGMKAVGDGKSTDGSRHIVAVVDRPDERPVWISVWGGANTLAQALRDVRKERSAEELARFVSKLRVYTISDQDDAGPWLRAQFPDLFYIVSPSNDDWKEYWRATWTGISGDRHYRNGPGHFFDMVDNPWLGKNIISHGPLGALYPRLAYIMEGDTPSFLGLVNNGLGWHESPAYGGWGGRYQLYRNYGETRPIWTNNADSRDTVKASDGKTYTSDQATVWRWREHYQNDFAARMDWSVAGDRSAANHNPVAVVNGDKTKGVLRVEVTSGKEVALSAEGTSDPDGNRLRFTWYQYPEAGSLAGSVDVIEAHAERCRFMAPQVKKPETVHVILEVRDDGSPNLVSYRRAIVTVVPPR